MVRFENLHTTPMGKERIRKNLGLKNEDVLMFCKQKLKMAQILRRGKNFYCESDGIVFTINAHSNTIITAHKI